MQQISYKRFLKEEASGVWPGRLLRSLQSGSRRLARDEEGVVLALSVLSFMVLFLMAFAVYAVGETVRQRIILQNAADAASYSAAVVQADTLSRLAVINRAMSWSWVQMNRMEMDYIVDKWLERVVFRWEIDNQISKQAAAPSNCSNGPYTGRDDWYTGQNYARREHAQLNRGPWVAIEEIKDERQKAAGDGKSYSALAPQIDELRQIIKDMNDKEEQLMNDLPDRIEECVEAVLRHNIKDTGIDQVAAGSGIEASISYVLLHSESPIDYTEILALDEEELFLIYGDYFGGPIPTFDRGTADGAGGNWWIRDYRSGGPDGIQRYYQQMGNRLVASWNWWGRPWFLVEGACVPSFPVQGYTEVYGQEVWSEPYFVSEVAKPRKLKKDFFGQQGTIVVGVARRMINPLFLFFRVKGQEGIYKGLTVDDYGRFMWTASAARASWNKNWPGKSNGEYDPTYWPGSIEDQNLRNTDWDAVMLPLHRAWADANDGTFSGETAGSILSEVRGGGWKTLYSGGGALGVQSAPQGMSGGEPDWAGLEGWTLH